MGLLSLFRKKKNQPKKEVDTKDRYSLEHLLLPEFVLGENGANILNMMLHEKGKFFTDLYGRMNEKTLGDQCPYSEEQFFVSGIRFENNDNLYMVKIEMPDPERVPLCKLIFIFHDQQMNNRRYITAEMTAPNTYVLCEWKAGHQHVNYGRYSEQNLRNITTEMK